MAANQSRPNKRTASSKPSILSTAAARLLALILTILVILFVVFLAQTVKRGLDSRAAVAEGRQVLQSLASRSVTDVEESIKAQVRIQKQQEFEEAVQQEDFSVSAAYETAVICGDSRAVGISLYGVLDEAHVFADIGASISKLKSDADTLETVNPTMLFLCYGLNDILNYGYNDAERWVADYKPIIQDLKKRLPSTQICVDSILPTLPGATVDQAPIDAYNAALKKMCDEIGVQYIDSTVLLRDKDNNPINTDYYEVDNEHFRKSFLEPWLTQMMQEAYRYEEN